MIYMDVCCLNRPFDDQTQDRIYLESVAVLSILERCSAGQWQILGSEAIDSEISFTVDIERKRKVTALTALSLNKVMVDDKIKLRAHEILEIGFQPFDALHLACAEIGQADVFLTTDDKLLSRAIKNQGKIEVIVENPVSWLMEVTANEHQSE